jgi:hypothetical protein
MRFKIYGLILTIFLFSCKSHSNATDAENERQQALRLKEKTALIENIKNHIAALDKRLKDQYNDEKDAEKRMFNQEKMIENVEEKEIYYQGKSIIKILIIENIVNRYKRINEYYYKKNNLIFIRINKLTLLENKQIETYNRELFYSKNKMLFDSDETNVLVNSSDLLKAAINKLNNEYKKV